jgi:hypothetical protein
MEKNQKSLWKLALILNFDVFRKSQLVLVFVIWCNMCKCLWDLSFDSDDLISLIDVETNSI